MNTFYLICFVLGLVMSLMAVFGLGRFHFGHMHFHFGAHHNGGGLAAVNGFTLPAFLCWFGGAGYLLNRYSPLVMFVVLLFAIFSGLVAAGVFYLLLFRFLVSREQLLSAEDTRMEGVLARVSDEIRPGGIGEILFTQTGARRGSPARSETGESIPRGTEVVVLRYAKGIAYVSPLDELTR